MDAEKIGDVSGAGAMSGGEIGEIVAGKVDFRREIRFAPEPSAATARFRSLVSVSNPTEDRAKRPGAEAGRISATSVAVIAEQSSISPASTSLVPNLERLPREKSPESGNHLEWHQQQAGQYS